jgi:4'-phosphopantetheinyl transferase
MPFFYQHIISQDAELAIWRIEESEDWFQERLILSDLEIQQLEAIKGHRRVEWLAVRYLTSQLLGGQSGAILKDEFGKPHLLHLPLQMSVSHSNGLAATILAKTLTGIDIQKIVPKIERIANRLLREEERSVLQAETRIEHLHVYWGAKEALYKAYGRRELDFCSNILIEPFQFDLANGICNGFVNKGNFYAEFVIYYQQLEDYMLVYALENARPS